MIKLIKQLVKRCKKEVNITSVTNRVSEAKKLKKELIKNLHESYEYQIKLIVGLDAFLKLNSKTIVTMINQEDTGLALELNKDAIPIGFDSEVGKYLISNINQLTITQKNLREKIERCSEVIESEEKKHNITVIPNYDK